MATRFLGANIRHSSGEVGASCREIVAFVVIEAGNFGTKQMSFCGAWPQKVWRSCGTLVKLANYPKLAPGILDSGSTGPSVLGLARSVSGRRVGSFMGVRRVVRRVLVGLRD